MSDVRAVPKPSMVARVEALADARAAQRGKRKRASGRKRRTSYGGSDWQRFRREILARDGYRCCLCGQPATDPHHIRGVGAGGKNEPENAISLCRLDHARVHDGLIERRRLYQVLAERYGYPERDDG